MIFGKFALDAVGKVFATAETPSGASTLNGAAYMQDEQGQGYPCITTDSVAAADGWIGGFRYTTAGALRCYDASAGMPASSSINQGIAMTDDGQVCYSSAAGTAVVNGVSVTADGAVSMAVMTFLAEFEDLGSGAVDTAVTFGGVSATFTRATTATTIGSTGLVVSVATGVARSYYDPTTLAYLGYLAEGARTNLCLQSEDLATTWAPLNATIASAITAPDGSATMKGITDDTTNGSHQISQVIALSDSTSYTISAFFKAGSLARGDFAVTSKANTLNIARFDLSAGTVEIVQNATAATIKSYQNGVYRVTMTYASETGATSPTHRIRCNNATGNSGYAGTGQTLYVWGAQLEAAAFASSYIPTTTAAVTRNADVLTYDTTGWLSATAGTMTVEFQMFYPTSLDPVRISDGTNNERILFGVGAADQMRMLVSDGGVEQANVGSATYTRNTTAKLAGAWAANDFASSSDGGNIATDTSGTLPTVNILAVGFTSYGPIRRVAYFNARLPNATLQSLTA